jgi:hypothetical protein
MRNTADVTVSKPIAIRLSISGVSAINSLVVFYDIHGRKREVLFIFFVPDTTRDHHNKFVSFQAAIVKRQAPPSTNASNILANLQDNINQFKNCIDQSLANAVGQVNEQQLQPIINVFGDTLTRVSKAVILVFYFLSHMVEKLYGLVVCAHGVRSRKLIMVKRWVTKIYSLDLLRTVIST